MLDDRDPLPCERKVSIMLRSVAGSPSVWAIMATKPSSAMRFSTPRMIGGNSMLVMSGTMIPIALVRFVLSPAAILL